MIRPAATCVIAIGGLSGSGKSVLARALAPIVGPAPGAVVVRSDEVRKRLFRVAAGSRLAAEGYADEVSRVVYGELAARASTVLGAGHAVLLDAVFLQPRTGLSSRLRRSGPECRSRALARRARVRFIDRVTERRGDVSDADAGVVRAQLAQSLDSLTWDRIDSQSTEAAVVDSARTRLGRLTRYLLSVTLARCPAKRASDRSCDSHR